MPQSEESKLPVSGRARDEGRDFIMQTPAPTNANPRLPAAASPAADSGEHAHRLNRRTLVKAGAAGVLVVAGTGSLRAYDQGVFTTGEGPAYDPWRAWPPYVQRDGIAALVGAAILAANPHNTQAWQFALSTDRIEIHSDLSRAGGALDPFLREHTIGLGCALENLVLAARANGYEPAITYELDHPDQGATIATDLLPIAPSPSELYDAIPKRHTNRGPYRNEVLAPETLASLETQIADLSGVAVQWFTSDEERAQFATLVIDANDAIDRDDDQSDETRTWFRTSWDAIQKYRDGLTIDTGGMSALTRVIGKMIPGRFVPLDIPEGPIKGTPVFGLLVVTDDSDRTQQLNGGRAWQRLHLWATANGLAMQPVDSPLVRADRERSLGLSPDIGARMEALVRDGLRPILPFRLGYPERTAELAPRRSVASVIVES